MPNWVTPKTWTATEDRYLLSWWEVCAVAALVGGLAWCVGSGVLSLALLAQYLAVVVFGIWTVPKTWTAVVVTVADLNTHLRDNLNLLKTSIGDDGYPKWTPLLVVGTQTLTTTDPYLIHLNGNFTLSLPASPITGKPYLIKNITTAGVNTIAGNGHNIDNVSTFTMGPHDAFTFYYNGAEWSVT